MDTNNTKITGNSNYDQLYQQHINEINNSDILWWYNKSSSRKNIPSYTQDQGQKVAYFYAQKMEEWISNKQGQKEIQGVLSDRSICEFWVLSLLNEHLTRPFSLPKVSINMLSIYQNQEHKDEVKRVVTDILNHYKGFFLKNADGFRRGVDQQIDRLFVIKNSGESVKSTFQEDVTLKKLFGEDTMPTLHDINAVGQVDKKNVQNCFLMFFPKTYSSVSHIKTLATRDSQAFLDQLKNRYRALVVQYHPDKITDDSQKKQYTEITQKYNVAYEVIKGMYM